MRNYETVIIFRTDATEATISAVTKKLDKIITKKPGKLTKRDDWGNKTLAYPIKKEKQGKYVIFHYSQEPKIVAEVDKALRFDETILRYATLVADEALEKHLQEMKTKKPAEPTEDDKGDRERNRDGYDVYVDYKDILSLARYITDRGKITPRRNSGVSAKSQRRISQAVKRARQIALLSYAEGTYIERPQFERPERNFDRQERGGYERQDRSFDRGDHR